jgi:hypothetical protein
LEQNETSLPHANFGFLGLRNGFRPSEPCEVCGKTSLQSQGSGAKLEKLALWR